ncbi:hypothetical protein K439DRAFT_1622350 [Ramaria rubella]|nr:hypothetical protein K439DRAFT_1622350 [Ramaria rubella]
MLIVDNVFLEAISVEAACIALCNRFGDINPKFTHPLSQRSMVLSIAATRCRRIVQEEKRLLACDRLKDRFIQGQLVWQKLQTEIPNVEEYRVDQLIDEDSLIVF